MGIRLLGNGGLLGFIRALGSSTAPTGAEGVLGAHLEDRNGFPLALRDNDKALAVQTAVPIGGFNDNQFRLARMDRSGGQAVALHTPYFTEPFDGATLHTGRWATSLTTYAVAQTAAGLNLNSGNSAAANAVAIATTLFKLPKMQRNPFYIKFRARYSREANSVMDFGVGAPVGNTLPSNGAYFRLAGTTGNVNVVINGAEVQASPGAVIDVGALLPGAYYTFDIFIDDDEAVFSIHDTQGNTIVRSTVLLPNSGYRIFGASRLPLYARLFSGGVAPVSAPAAVISDVYAGTLDQVINRPVSDFLATLGMGSGMNPQSGAQLAQWTNSAEPANATLSNTAAGYTTLGGKFQFAAVAGAVTDYLLFAFTVPDPNTLRVKRIRIDTKNAVAAVATTAHELEWFVVTNLTAANLTGATAARMPLGLQAFPIAAAVSSLATPIDVDLSDSPIACMPGRVFGIGLRMPIATATATQIIKGTVAIAADLE
jgi:hypothetical protein